MILLIWGIKNKIKKKMKKNLKNYPDELIYRTETDSEKELMSPGGRDRLRVWD